MPDFTLYQFQLNLPREVIDAFEEELQLNGIVKGLFSIGPDAILADTIFMFWVNPQMIRQTGRVARTCFGRAESARNVARDFAAAAKGAVSENLEGKSPR